MAKEDTAAQVAPPETASPLPPPAEIEKIKLDGQKVTISYLTGEGTGEAPERITRERTAPPHPDFIKARDALIPFILALCEIPGRAGVKVETRGVSFSRNSDGAEGAVLTGFRHYAESLGGMAINTPVHYVEDDQPQRRFSPEAWAAITAFRDEALLYLSGKAAQQDLFEPAAGDGQATGAPEIAEPAAKGTKPARTKKAKQPA